MPAFDSKPVRGENESRRKRMKQIYHKTKYPNIFWYDTKKGKKYRVRRAYFELGKKKEFDKSGYSTLAEARYALNEVEEKIKKNELGLLSHGTMTVDDYWEIYSNKKIEMKRWSEDSERGNMSLYRNHIQPTFGKIQMNKLERNQYELWIERKLKEYRRDSVRTINTLFMALLNDAVLNGSLERNRLKNIGIGVSEIPKRNKKLTIEEYTKWMAAAKEVLTPFAYAWVYLTIYGFRRGEVAGLSLNSIQSIENGQAVLHVFDSRTLFKPNGKGGVKTQNSDRIVTLDKEGTRQLMLIIEEAKEIKKDFGKILHKNDFLMLNPQSGKTYHPTQLNRWFDIVTDSIALDTKPSPHIMRHFFAAQALMSGSNIGHVAAYLGHTQKYMTEQYAELEKEKSLSKGVVDLFSKQVGKSGTND